ncbi:hypothetical protein PoB_006575100 [Plakobranchus ocellatus]|uniref:Uncharacterized protein n=1 Tax=Plakobranchus ocellatus TaxID=259542 RepID=A0AAV4D582_9GAST|nr:hypothetical protein PoB_006575100 [Plakobranchus ocellatus]
MDILPRQHGYLNCDLVVTASALALQTLYSVWFLYKPVQKKGDLRLSDTPSGQGAGAGLYGEPTSTVGMASPQQGDLRLSGPPSGQGAGSGARTRDRMVPADLRADSQATVLPTPQLARQIDR